MGPRKACLDDPGRARENAPRAPQAFAGPGVEILTDLKKHTGKAPYVFTSQLTWRKPLSENTLNAALRRLGYSSEEHVAHGFRASASSLLNESGKWRADAIEAELAHMGADQVRKAYHRAAYWDCASRWQNGGRGNCSDLLAEARRGRQAERPWLNLYIGIELR
jgi:hypothetical protein